MLSVNKINTFYGPIQALYDVYIEIGEEEIVSIIGANGAGKSSYEIYHRFMPSAERRSDF